MTVMGDALMNGLSDRGSIPLRSTEEAESNLTCSLFLFLTIFMLFLRNIIYIILQNGYGQGCLTILYPESSNKQVERAFYLL